MIHLDDAYNCWHTYRPHGRALDAPVALNLMIYAALRSHRKSLLDLCQLAPLCATLLLSACGGGSTNNGGGGGGGVVDNPPDFSLQVEVPSLTLQQGGAYQIQTVYASLVNGFNGTINLTVSGLPAGVQTIPATIPPLSQSGTEAATSFQLVASPTATLGSSTITLTAKSGSLTHTTTFTANLTPVAPFVIQTSPSALTMTPATTANVQVSVSANAGTSPQLRVTLSTETTNPLQNGGVTVSPPQGLLTPANPVTFNIAAEVSAQTLQSFPIVVTATDSSNNSSVSVFPLSVSVPFASNTTPTRSTFARTDQGPMGVTYDQARKLIFVSVETLNQVDVFSSLDGRRVATVPVMYPAGIDESADGSAVYVVSPYGPLVSTIDPNSFQVVRQTQLPSGDAGLQVATLSTGDVLLELASLTTADSSVLRWSPSADTFQRIGLSGLISRSADHTKVLVQTPGRSYIYDAATQNSFALGCHADKMAISPDASQVVAVGFANSPTTFCDLNGTQLGTISLGFQPLYGAIYSLDGKHAYVFGDDFGAAGDVVADIDTSTFSLLGIVPGFNFQVGLPFTSQWITPFAIDETNMLFGGSSMGMAYLDVSSSGMFNLPTSRMASVQPTLLSLESPVQIQISGAQFSSNWNYSAFFGTAPAALTSQVGTNLSVQSINYVNVTAPAGTTSGPGNVTLQRSDGYFQVLPDWVSYGPYVLQVDANAGSPAGADAIQIVGYGFDSSNTQVSIGGKQATITQVKSAISTSQFGTERILLSTPANTPGNADVTVTTPGGSTTVSKGFQYLASSKIYPITGALDDLVYDQSRQRLYISNQDHNRIEIFDLGSQTYLTPIAVGNQPTSLALTPDASELAVLNAQDQTVSVVNIAGMQVTSTFGVTNGTDCGNAAFELSPVAPHRVLVDLVCTALLDTGVFHLLDLDTGSLSCTGIVGCASGNIAFGSGEGAMASTPDGRVVLLTDYYDAIVGLLNFASNKLTTANLFSTFDAAADADANVFAAQFSILDPRLSQFSLLAFEPYADSGAESLHNRLGQKLNPSGSILFVPQDSGVDIFDVHKGRLAMHVVAPEPIPSTSGALALDETGTKMFLISNSGITIAQLFQAPLSVASLSPAQGATGITVTVRGSGFQSGAKVTFADSQVPATYVDQNTLTATVPSISAGAIRITVTNPDGDVYGFDAAFTVQ